MSNKARDWARFAKDLTTAEHVVLRELAEFYNDEEGCAWPSVETLQEGCGDVSIRTIRRALVALTERGFITREQRGTAHQKSVYTLAFNIPSTVTNIPSVVVSTYHPGYVNIPSTVLQHTIQGIAIRNEPLRTIKEPLIEPVPVEVQPATDGNNFFTRTVKAYDLNISLITPMIADEIRAFAEDDSPPADWGELAIREAVNNNKRSWSYAKAVLNRFIAQGSTEDTRRRTNGRSGISEDFSIDALDAIARKQGNL